MANSSDVMDMLIETREEIEGKVRELNLELNAINTAIDVLNVGTLYYEENAHAESIAKNKAGRPNATDEKVINVLTENGGKSAKQIADEAQIHPTYVFKVLKRMQDDDVIRKYSKRYYLA